LSTVLIEREDFASGTSSKSTKLVHGGVRYLEKAVFNLDYDQFKLVREALQERRSLLDNAGHLTSALPIIMPCYKWWEVPFYWSGLKAYDLIAGFKNLASSKYLTPSESQRRLPTLADSNEDGSSLKGSVRQAAYEFQQQQRLRLMFPFMLTASTLATPATRTQSAVTHHYGHPALSISVCVLMCCTDPVL
jgi:glycerol-3-phosphate dehydrogenase